MKMLWKRLASYPCELQDFFQHIFDNIDPSYKRHAGRLLLMMLERDGRPELITVPFLDSYKDELDFCSDHRWSPKSYDELYDMLDRAIVCASKWGKDILRPIDNNEVQKFLPE